MNKEEIKEFRIKNAKWRAGEIIPPLKLKYNTLVIARMPDGTTKEGWIVGASIDDGPDPVYTIESKDRSPDFECPESLLAYVKK